ncbi:MAG: nuclear transport factor 2 family protein [Chthoniobacterales bacterium]
MSASRELLAEVYSAFNKRDIPRVLARMHPDVVWPNGMEGGRVHGHKNVRGYWERQWKMIDPHAEPMRIEEDESGQSVVTVHQIVRDLDGNVLMDRVIQHVYSFQDDLILRMEIRESGPES